MTILAAPVGTPSDERRAGALVAEILCAVGAVAACLGLVANYTYVYLQFFSVEPAITPATLGVHRALLATALLLVLATGVAAWVGRRGWRWTAVLAGLVLTTAGTVTVQGAVPGLG